MAKTKTQKKNYQSWMEGRRKLEDDNLFSKYSNRFKRKKEVDGKWVDWDIRTDTPWNPEAAWNTIYQNVYGTETPGTDFKYLKAKETFENEQNRIKNDAFANLRRQFSPKTVNKGERQIDVKREEDRLKKETELRALRQDSSFRIDHESIPNWEGGNFEAIDETTSLSEEALSSGTNGQNNDITEVNKQKEAEFEQKVAKDRSILKNSNASVETINAATNNSYTTNFREAFRNANKTQAWEDTMDSGAPLEKSNVFSQAAMDWGQYKEGDTLGVMTRNQRRAYDEAVSAMNQQKLADEATGGSGIYGEKGKEMTKEWTTDQEANEEGKVIGMDAQESTKGAIEETSDILDNKELEKGISMGS